MRIVMMFVAVALLAIGCRSSEREAIESKCDASLRKQAEERVRAGDDTPLEVLGRADGPIDQSERGRLEKAFVTKIGPCQTPAPV